MKTIIDYTNALKGYFASNKAESNSTVVDYTPIVAVDDALPITAKALKVKVDAVQDLHGYNNPWVGGAGKNKQPLVVDDIKSRNVLGTWSGNTYTRDNVSFTLDTDNAGNITSITVNTTGGADDIKDLYLSTATFGDYLTTGQSYKINGTPGGATSNDCYLRIEKAGAGIENIRSDYTFNYGGTSDEQAYYLLVRVVKNAVLSNVKVYPMIRLSTESNTFEPYTNICPITGWDNAKVTRAGKNLYNKEAQNVSSIANKTSITQITNGIRVTAVESSSYLSITQIVIDDLTAYEGRSLTLKCKYTHKSSNGILCALQAIKNGTEVLWDTMDGINGEAWTTVNITSAHAGATLYFKAYISASNTISVGDYTDYTNIQIEVGSTATEYEPYKETKEITISLNGTRYGGTLDVTSGVLTLTHGYKDLGTLEWTYVSSYTYFRATISDIKGYGYEGSPNMICSAYEALSYSSWDGSNNGIAVISNDGKIGVKDGRYTDAASFTTAVSGVQLVYELATPQTIQLTPEQVKLLQGYNTIWTATGNTYLEYLTQSVGNIAEVVGELEEQLTDEVSTRATLGAHNLINVSDYVSLVNTSYSDGTFTNTQADTNASCRLIVVAKNGSGTDIGILVHNVTVSTTGVQTFDVTVPTGTKQLYIGHNGSTKSLGVIVRFDGEGQYKLSIDFTGIDIGTVGGFVMTDIMMRLATDTDSTYQPYAKTNVELTDALSANNLTAYTNISGYSASNNKYIAPSDGYVYIKKSASNSNAFISAYIYGADGIRSFGIRASKNEYDDANALFVKKGMMIYITNYETGDEALFLPLV